MRNLFICSFLLCLSVSAQAAPLKTIFHADNSVVDRLEIWGDEDLSIVTMLITSFQLEHPNIEVSYSYFKNHALYNQIERTHLENTQGPDVILSSLQTSHFKLANDGYLKSFNSANTELIPGWGKWRSELYVYALEPIVTVIHSDLLLGDDLPNSRQQLLNLLDNKSALVAGKLGVSKIESDGIGFFAWSLDRQQTATYGRLLQMFKEQHAQSYLDSSALLNAMLRGEIFVAYNVAGGTARFWNQKYPWIISVMPSDYTTLISHTASVSEFAKNDEIAVSFVDHIIGNSGQKNISDKTSLISYQETTELKKSLGSLKSRPHGILKIPSLDLPLLLHIDQSKRTQIFSEWPFEVKE